MAFMWKPLLGKQCQHGYKSFFTRQLGLSRWSHSAVSMLENLPFHGQGWIEENLTLTLPRNIKNECVSVTEQNMSVMEK